jgi:DNA repair protein RadC
MSTLRYRQPSSAGALVVRELLGRYEIHGQLSEDDVLEAASEILLEKVRRQGVMDRPETVRQFLQARLGGLDHERMEVLWLDSQHQLIAVETLAIGTLNQATVFPREVVKAALRHNANSALLVHNHPSGRAEPSAADRSITERLKQALGLIDVRVIDHMVVSANESVSFAQRGWL